MIPEKQQLLQLIIDYKEAVAKAIVLINSKSHREPGFQWIECEGQGRSGYLDALKQSCYALHGCGCLVITPEFEVDFDFGRCDGIDTWFVYNFMRDSSSMKDKYPLLQNGEQIAQLLHELEEAGIVAKDVDLLKPHAYFLVADIPNPPALRAEFFSPNEDNSEMRCE